MADERNLVEQDEICEFLRGRLASVASTYTVDQLKVAVYETIIDWGDVNWDSREWRSSVRLSAEAMLPLLPLLQETDLQFANYLASYCLKRIPDKSPLHTIAVQSEAKIRTLLQRRREIPASSEGLGSSKSHKTLKDVMTWIRTQRETTNTTPPSGDALTDPNIPHR